MKDHIEESDVGITEYITSDLTSLEGIVKARYSDFLVNEIDSTGRLCYISKTETNAETKPPIIEETKELTKDYKEKVKEAFKEFNEHYADFIDYIENITEGNIPKYTVFKFNCTSVSKTNRTMFHKAIKENCPSFETNTMDENGEKIMHIALTEGLSKSKRKKYQMDKREPKSSNPYLCFDMMKTNMESMAALFKLSKATGKAVKSFTMAGTKDKRGITTQRISVITYDAGKTRGQLQSVAGLKIGNFTEEKEGLKLGDLQGNRFCLALRNFSGDEETTKKSNID